MPVAATLHLEHQIASEAVVRLQGPAGGDTGPTIVIVAVREIDPWVDSPEIGNRIAAVALTKVTLPNFYSSL